MQGRTEGGVEGDWIRLDLGFHANTARTFQITHFYCVIKLNCGFEFLIINTYIFMHACRPQSKRSPYEDKDTERSRSDHEDD